jgi:hypothetical protein
MSEVASILKRCSICEAQKPLSEFQRDGRRRDGRFPYCAECNSARMRGRYEADAEGARRRARKNGAPYRQSLRDAVFSHYGSSCACCGESEQAFLTIDHIAGGGSQHRKALGTGGGTRFYCWLRSNGFPQGYRTLCHNCNAAHGVLGYCPHERAREEAV